MAEHTPPLEPGQLLGPELPILASPTPPALVNGEGPQQVILVQVNPGEAFTIRREDGQFQCITGPAQVPMMSPNGSVPPIYVPPGYISQIIEENGVRRVLVLPQQPEFHPGGHSPLHHAPPPPHAHLPAFIPHPAMMAPPPPPPPPAHLYTGMAGGVGDMSSQYISQYHPAHIYSEQVSADSHPQHGRPSFVHRDDRTSKTYERLQKKLKDRQTGGGGSGGGGGPAKDSPPPSPQKTRGSPAAAAPPDLVNGVVEQRAHRGKNGEAAELDAASRALQAALSAIAKPSVSDIRARVAEASWSAPATEEDGGGEGGVPVGTLSYELSVSFSGKDGKYKSVYCGEELGATLENLRPATDYHVRVQATRGRLQGSPSEAASFSTLSCEPEVPNVPKKTSGTKNSLVLQWKAPCDNGSKVHSYILQWDEGKGAGVFEQCYYGPLKQYRVSKLSPASRYSFRLAAKNDVGVSDFSDPVELFTSCSVPSPPLPPELEKAGVDRLALKWQRPAASPKEDDVGYVLEMDEEGSGYGFQPSYNGEELSFTVQNLHRSTKYRFRVAAYNSEGKSNPSSVVEFVTDPDRPGCPSRPVAKGKVLPTSFKLAWDPPRENGGAQVTKYVLELSEASSGSPWEQVYSGAALEHVCDALRPGRAYQARVYCVSQGGNSPLSESLQVQTPAVPPGACQPPRAVGKAKAREVQLRWGAPQVDGGSPVTCYSVELSVPRSDESREVYQGPDLDCCVAGLSPGRTYGFRLKAGNKAGFGPFSERCDVTTGPGAPEPCRAPCVTCKSPTCAVVSWEAPPCNGAPVTDFRLEWGAAEGCLQVCYSGPALAHEMKGLLPATNYFCRVQAVNSAGTGLFSEAVLCQTPCSVPAAVANVWAMKESELLRFGVPRQDDDDDEEEDDEEEEEEEEDEEGTRQRRRPPLYSPSTCAGLCWDPPCDHGSEITSYLIDLGERQESVPAVPASPAVPAGRHVLCRLQPDTGYRIRVQALNSLGAGPFSPPYKLKTKPLPPAPPRLECAAFSHHTLRLKWGEGPARSDALHYRLQMEDRSGRFTSLYEGTCQSHKVQRLNESTSYAFRVQASNEAGAGPFSAVYTFATPRSPPAPLKAPKVERTDEGSCEVSWEALSPMKGDPIVYTLQMMTGNADFKQAYKGPGTCFTAAHLHANSDYRFRVCAVRQCQDATELSGPFSPAFTLAVPRGGGEAPTARSGANAAVPSWSASCSPSGRRGLTDEQCAFLLLMAFAVIAILIAFVIQYFVIK
ncbi:fibronectin type-III domain-containing protein 3A isoform X2 [Stigmatopora nigra]